MNSGAKTNINLIYDIIFVTKLNASFVLNKMPGELKFPFSVRFSLETSNHNNDNNNNNARSRKSHECESFGMGLSLIRFSNWIGCTATTVIRAQVSFDIPFVRSSTNQPATLGHIQLPTTTRVAESSYCWAATSILTTCTME